MNVSGAQRLKSLQDENAKLKKLLAEAMLDMAILKDVPAKNGSARCKAGCGGTRSTRPGELVGAVLPPAALPPA